MRLLSGRYTSPMYRTFTNNFTKGLQCDKSGFDAKPDYSPSACNVDFMQDGGFCLRRSARSFSPTSLPSKICKVGYFEPTSSQSWSVVGLQDGSVWASGGDGQPYGQIIAPGGPCVTSFNQVHGKLQILNGGPVRVWDGTTVSTLGSAWNVSPPGNPTYNTNSAPSGLYGLEFGGHMHIAGTTEGGVFYCNRIRQSMPLINLTGQTDYRQSDYFDIPPGNSGDCIVGLAACGERMFVVREHSIWMLSGVDYTDYRLTPITQSAGASGPHAMACCDDRLWAWDSVEGLHWTAGYDINGAPQRGNVSAPIHCLIRDMKLKNPADVTLSCCNKKIMVSTDSVEGRVTYVFDTVTNTWTKYDLALGPSSMFSPNGNRKTECTAASWDPDCPNRVLKLEQMESSDECGSGERPIEAFVTTGWMSDGRPLDKKHVTCITYVLESDSDAPIQVSIAGDWDESNVLQNHSIQGPVVADPWFIGPRGGKCTPLHSRPLEKLTPDAEPTPIKCPEHGAGDCAKLKSKTGKTQKIRKHFDGCSVCVLQFTFRSPASATRWCIRGFGFEYELMEAC